MPATRALVEEMLEAGGLRASGGGDHALAQDSGDGRKGGDQRRHGRVQAGIHAGGGGGGEVARDA